MTYPITPPPELVEEWRHQWACCPQNCDSNLGSYIATQAAQWGWDQRGVTPEAELQQARDEELEACLEWLVQEGYIDAPCRLRIARRPKPPSLKEQALAELEKVDMLWDTSEFSASTLSALDTIRLALEALPND